MTPTATRAIFENLATAWASTRSPIDWLARTAPGSTKTRLSKPPIQAATAVKCSQSTATPRYAPDSKAAAWLFRLLVSSATPVAARAAWPGRPRTPRQETDASANPTSARRIHHQAAKRPRLSRSNNGWPNTAQIGTSAAVDAWPMATYSVPARSTTPLATASRRLRAAASCIAAGLLRPNSGRNTRCQLSRVPNNALAASENHHRPIAVSGANCACDDSADAAATPSAGIGPMISGKAPLTVWPSTADRVRHETVYTPFGSCSGSETTSDLGSFGATWLSPRSTASRCAFSS